MDEFRIRLGRTNAPRAHLVQLLAGALVTAIMVLLLWIDGDLLLPELALVIGFVLALGAKLWLSTNRD